MKYYHASIRMLKVVSQEEIEDVLLADNVLVRRNIFNVYTFPDGGPIADVDDAYGYIEAYHYPYQTYLDKTSLQEIPKAKVLTSLKRKD